MVTFGPAGGHHAKTAFPRLGELFWHARYHDSAELVAGNQRFERYKALDHVVVIFQLARTESTGGIRVVRVSK